MLPPDRASGCSSPASSTCSGRRVGFAAVKLLEEAGCTVEVPEAQTCCGQPAYNSGDRADTQGHRPAHDRGVRRLRLRRRAVRLLRRHDQGALSRAVRRRAGHGRSAPSIWRRAPTSWSRSFTTCAACATSPRATTASSPITTPAPACASSASSSSRARCSQSVAGLTLVELPGAEVCCGFGGTFCVKYPEISDKMVDDEGRRHRRDRRRHAARRRPRLPDEHGRQAEAPADRGGCEAGARPPCRRGRSPA